MRTVAFIPIKLNSQRLPHKNILPLGGKPLCWHIFNTALECSEIDEVFVYCSDVSITNYIPEGVKLLIRDSSLDSNETKGLDIYKSFVSQVKADIYVLMHATAPYMKSSSVDDALRHVKSGEYDSAFSAEKIQTFVWYDGKPLNYDFEDVPRTQDIKPIMVETSGFYIFTKRVINCGRRIGDHPFVKDVDYRQAIDIDNECDYNHAVSLWDKAENDKFRLNKCQLVR